jgi:hypothetical protein
MQSGGSPLIKPPIFLLSSGAQIAAAAGPAFSIRFA